MKELIAIFLENLYPEMNEDSASRALDVCNEEYQRDTVKAIEGRFEKDSREKMKG